MSDAPRTVRLVLDASAVAAWVHGSLAVGELIAEIDDEHGAVILPLPCLVEAAQAISGLDDGRLDILAAHPAVLLQTDDPDDWRLLAAIRALVERPDMASAALLALDSSVDVLTREPEWYAQVAGGGIALPFGD